MRLFVDNLINVDFSFLHPTRGVVGETWLASVELEGELDEQGMVCDFGIVKKMLRHWLDEEIDHRLLVPGESSELEITEQDAFCSLTWKTTNGEIALSSPNQAVTQINAREINAETVARWCIDQLKPKFPSSVHSLKLRFTPEDIDGPYYHYSHGLKKHGGNCQRIAHGHRSKILIWRNGNLDEALMKQWAKLWQDIYIGTQEDLVNSNSENDFAFEYQAQQGAFKLNIPKSFCYLISSDSTIECISQHIADTLKEEFPDDSFTVKAFEGLAKGAIAES